MSVCVSVPRDHTNRCNDMVLLQRKDSSREGFYLFWASVPPTSQDKTSPRKNESPSKILFYTFFFFKLKFIFGGGLTLLPFHLP